MTITTPSPTSPTVPTYNAVVFDLYRDIHKGIRSELFSVTTNAGKADPSVRASRLALQSQVHSLVELLVHHAGLEEASVQPAIELYVPDVAEAILHDHARLEARMEDLEALAAETLDAPDAEQRARVQQLYIELASFTSAYLAHQDVEERIAMPALDRALGVEGLLPIHASIVSSIPPAEMATFLALMLPAMNVDDRTELLGGMQQDAPAEVFSGVWGLARTVLSPSEHTAVGKRLGIA